MSTIFAGLMSGTSLDGIDGVLVDFGAAEGELDVLAHESVSLAPALKDALLALNRSSDDEIHRAALAANALARAYASVVDGLLRRAGVEREEVVAIGCHGQTVRHRPGEFDGTGYTVQLNAPALLAELTGIDVVADFRSRDLAAGGHGAPLAPAFHRALFGRTGDGATLAVLNLGGIGNVSGLFADGRTIGFDCGPGNALLDAWCLESTGRPFDDAGAFAASGRVDARLLQALLDEPFFAMAPPKSTGRDLFHRDWLEQRLAAADARARLGAADVQATLSELTAEAAARAVGRYVDAAGEVVVCGGGAFNTDLMQRLGRLLSPRKWVASSDRGLPPDQVEAVAFAWLARAFVERRPGNLPSVTGAAGPRVLGALYPAR